MQDLYHRQIELENDCIDHGYTGDNFGYQKTRYYVDGVRKSALRHRIVYCEANGISLESIKGWVIRHKCDNPRCINPQHLLLGTQMENVQDRVKRGRDALGEANGLAKLTAQDVLFIRSHYTRGRGKPYNTVALGRMFNVSPRNISDIIHRETWKHI